MDFGWSEILNFFWIAVSIVFVKTFFEKKEDEKFFSPSLVTEILILTVLLFASTWLLSYIT